jgi:hypothetical protein
MPCLGLDSVEPIQFAAAVCYRLALIFFAAHQGAIVFFL